MNDEWKKYPRNRRIKNKDSYVLIMPDSLDISSKKRMPIFCEICSFCFSSVEDKKSFDKFGCCSICADTWAYSNVSKWKDGWRPNKEQVALAVEKRSEISCDIRFE